MKDKEENELILLFKKLISIPSISGTEEVYTAISYIHNWFTGYDIESEIIYCHGVANIIARVGKKQGKKLLLNAHIDVVPVGEYINWNYAPFAAYEENGYIYGRGTSDSKSGVAAMMMVMKLLKEKEEELQGQVEFMITGAEENGSEYGTIELLERFHTKYDAAIVGEPSDMCMEIGQRGLRWLELQIHGIASHSARPHLGINAIAQAGKIMNELQNLSYGPKNELFEEGLQEGSISVNKIHGGIQNNIIPEDCKMVLDCRLMPGDTKELLKIKVQEVINRVVDPRCYVEMKFLGDGWDPFIVEEQEPIVLKMKQAYYEIMKKQIVVRGKAGCTDASHIYKKGIPVLIFGPGNPNESHSSNEKVKISNLFAMTDILKSGVEKFLNDGSEGS